MGEMDDDRLDEMLPGRDLGNELPRRQAFGRRVGGLPYTFVELNLDRELAPGELLSFGRGTRVDVAAFSSDREVGSPINPATIRSFARGSVDTVVGVVVAPGTDGVVRVALVRRIAED